MRVAGIEVNVSHPFDPLHAPSLYCHQPGRRAMPVTEGLTGDV